MENIKKKILSDIEKGKFKLTFHAIERMNERNVTLDDIKNVALTCSGFTWQDQHESYLIEGLGLEGNKLFVTADIIDEVIIITVFYEENN